MKNFKGFTLIEVLVVMTIIGVLASVVLISFSGQRERAKLTTAKQFDAQVSHALGAYAVGIWRFEEGSDITLYDESGFGNDGTFVGNLTPVFPVGVYSGTTALQFDGVNDYVDCGNDPSLNITDAITVEAWVKPVGTGDNLQNIVKKLDYGGHKGFRLHFYTNGTFRFAAHDGTSYFSVMENNVMAWNKWQHLVGVYDGSYLHIYRNGQFIKKNTGPSAISPASSHLTFGNGEDFNGAIDDVSIYNSALSSAQIQQHFVAGAPAHGIAIK